MSEQNRVMGVVFMVVGGFMLVTAAASVWFTSQFRKTAQRADGVVKELNHGPAHPQIEFKLPSGETHEFPANGWISYRQGQRAKVLYTMDQEGVDEARLDDGGDLWYSAVSRTGLGLVFLVVGAIARRRSALKGQ